MEKGTKKEIKYILKFDEISKKDVPSAGGKGANLGEMTGAGIPVPSGVVLTAAAYDRFMEENDIDVNELLTLQPDVKKAAQQIRNEILRGDIPEEIRQQILAFYREMAIEKPNRQDDSEKSTDNAEEPGSARVAVRSSATAEDLDDASFAGQQETYLNVVGSDMLFEKIRQCYASLWGDRAVSYRKAKGYDKQKVSLAVVIQQMVESESAGVLFTRNPADNSEDILINASYGLGEAVVSGVVSPDEYVVGRDGKAKQIMIGSKEVQIVYRSRKTKTTPERKDASEENGTVKIPVPKELRGEQVLSKDMIKKLTELSLEIETHYGHPMDIEWAIRNGEIYILQARSITTIKKDNKEEAMVEETPVESEFEGLPAVKPAKGKMRENVLFNMEKTPTPYYPLDHDFAGEIGRQKEVLFDEVGLEIGGQTYPINDDGITLFTKAKFSVNRKVFGIPSYLQRLNDHEENRKAAKESLDRCRSEFELERALNPEGIRAIGESLERMRKLIAETAYGRFRYALFPGAICSMSMDKKLKKVREDLDAYGLVDGLSYVTADINREMAYMSDRIRENEDQTQAVLNLGYEEIVEEYPELKEMFEEFLAKFGYKSDFNCYCFIAKTWNEEPDRFIKTLRPMLRGKSFMDLSMDAGKERHTRVMKEIKRTLPEKDYAKVKVQVKAFRFYHYIREASQYLWETEFYHCRRLLEKCAEKLGCDTQDLWYLFAEELFAVCKRGKLSEDDLEKIARRKAKRPLAESYWKKGMLDALATGNDSITGIGGSAGQARGHVCIIKSPEEFDKLKQGDILVCTYTDPEWTPLFTLAAGVVVDTGGTLSHAAIVAREYGIPAVLATGDATKKLKDGDTVFVDGTKGQVEKI